MASKDYQTLMRAHSNRARALAQRYPAAAEVLVFYAYLAEFQASIFSRTHKFKALCLLTDDVIDFVESNGPKPLRDAAAQLDLSSFTQAIADYWQRRDTSSVVSFFARVVLQPYAVGNEVKPVILGENVCPRCGHLPQVGVLRPQGHGRAINLVCSLCMNEWSFRRGCCPGCLEGDESQLEFYSAQEFDYFQVQACGSCNRYILNVDVGKEPEVIPFVDELSALPLDLWACEKGFQKLQPSLVGI